MRGFVPSMTAPLGLCAWGHHRSPMAESMVRRDDCAELLNAADQARALGEKALAAAPPEGIDARDAKGCVAYGLSLNLAEGNPAAAASGAGNPDKVAACEKILGEPAGAGIPVP